MDFHTPTRRHDSTNKTVSKPGTNGTENKERRTKVLTSYPLCVVILVFHTQGSEHHTDSLSRHTHLGTVMATEAMGKNYMNLFKLS